MKTYEATARPWTHGWELHVDGVGVTQVKTLEQAQQQVLDLIETMAGKPSRSRSVEIHIELGPLAQRVDEARNLTRQASDLQVRAAAANRRVVTDLRDAGLSLTDIAFVMGVSRGRVSQLLAGRPQPSVAVDYEHRPRRKPQRKSA